jgi:hypothetical protein
MVVAAAPREPLHARKWALDHDESNDMISV